jgi:hypothetical protein
MGATERPDIPELAVKVERNSSRASVVKARHIVTKKKNLLSARNFSWDESCWDEKR